MQLGGDGNRTHRSGQLRGSEKSAYRFPRVGIYTGTQILKLWAPGQTLDCCKEVKIPALGHRRSGRHKARPLQGERPQGDVEYWPQESGKP
jgi:hypothetical protein